jgi:hypothetical protein
MFPNVPLRSVTQQASDRDLPQDGDVRAAMDETTSRLSAATATDVRAAARALHSGDGVRAVAHRRFSVHVLAGGGLLVALLIVLVASVIWVSDDSKHPLVQPDQPSPPTTTAVSPTVAASPPGAIQPPPVEASTPPMQAMPSPDVTADTMAPDAPPQQRLRRLHRLFPHLFPSA